MSRDPPPMLLPPALRRPGFPGLAGATLCGTAGFVGEQVILGWLAVERTGSPLFVGVVLGLRMLPMFLLGVPAGALADRLDPLHLMRRAGAGLAGVQAGLGALVLLGRAEAWLLPLASLGLGVGHAFFGAARQGAAHALAGHTGLASALATLGMAGRLGGLAGALAAGALMTRSPVAACALLALAYAGGTLATRGRAAPPAGPVPARESWRAALGRALRAARDEPAFRWVLSLTVAVEILGFSHQAVLPSLARDVLGIGAGGLGVLNAARSAGGLVATGALAVRPSFGGTPTQALVVVVLFGAGLLGLAAAPGYGTVVLAVLAVNAVAAACDILTQTLVQRALPPDRRGSAGGAWVAAVGTAPLGQLQIGALASALGVPLAVALNGLGLVAVAVVGALTRPRRPPV